MYNSSGNAAQCICASDEQFAFCFDRFFLEYAKYFCEKVPLSEPRSACLPRYAAPAGA